jgi:lysophospholipase L1-like esterase
VSTVATHAGPVVTNAPALGPEATRWWSRVVGVGDSVIAGTGDQVDGYPDVSWFDHVVALLGPDATSANLGVVGLRSAAIRETQLDRALALRPDLVMLSAGGNDMFARDFDPDAVADDLDHMVRALRAAGADVLMFGFYDLGHMAALPPAFRDRLSVNNPVLAAITRDLARRYGAIHIDNSHRQVTPNLMSADAIHFNRRGHAHIAATVAEVLGLTADRPPTSVGSNGWAAASTRSRS